MRGWDRLLLGSEPGAFFNSCGTWENSQACPEWNAFLVCIRFSSAPPSSIRIQVTILCPDVAVDSTGDVGGVMYTKRNVSGLTELVNDPSRWAELSTSCTSDIDIMTNLFMNSTFNGDISTWDTSKVTDMSRMFYWSTDFNRDIGDDQGC